MSQIDSILVKAGRLFYGIGIITFGINQLVWDDFRFVILPPWPSWRMSPGIWAYLFGVVLIAVGLAIIFEKQARVIALVLGGTFLALIIFWHLPYMLFVFPHHLWHLGVWTDVGKELAHSGGAFVVAGSFSAANATRSSPIKLLERLIPFGPVFFSMTMIAFGIDHFLYTDFVAKLVPGWIPWHVFWTYLGGVALIGSGAATILRIKLRTIALLQGTMLFLWFILLHVPDAITRPTLLKGNEVVSAADALAFSGTAFLIACAARQRKMK